MKKRIFLPTGVALSFILVWFTLSNYRAARPMAEENLHGLALSLAAAIENMAVRDPSLNSLAGFHTPDVAYFTLVDRYGIYRYHSNADLIGTHAPNRKSGEAPTNGSLSETRVTLGTGEKAYEFTAPLDLSGQPLALQLILHTYRADAVIRRAKLSTAVLLSLLAAGWVLAVILHRFTLRDERHQLDMARRESLAQLGEMGAMLAHEIRNPLAGIKGFAQMIEKKPHDDRNGGFAARIVTETVRLESLVNDLLTYARDDTSARSPVKLDELIIHTVSLIRPEAEQLKVTITGECPEGIQISGNRDRLGQLLLNLGKNALQAMPKGGSLRIAANASDGGVLTIAVTDSGHGISKDDMPRIFEPFFTTRARGTGLGLALCKKIVEEHRGSIRVESTAECGTSIEIHLPAQYQDTGSRSL